MKSVEMKLVFTGTVQDTTAEMMEIKAFDLILIGSSFVCSCALTLLMELYSNVYSAVAAVQVVLASGPGHQYQYLAGIGKEDLDPLAANNEKLKGIIIYGPAGKTCSSVRTFMTLGILVSYQFCNI